MTIGCDYSADDKKYYALQYVDHIINKITNHGIYKSEEDAIDAIHAWWGS